MAKRYDIVYGRNGINSFNTLKDVKIFLKKLDTGYAVLDNKKRRRIL